MAELPACISITANSKANSSVTLCIRVQTRASKVGPLGYFGDSKEFLKWGVNSVPENNKANKELQAQIAKLFKLPKSSVRLIAGEKSRQKTLELRGISAGEIADTLKDVLTDA